MPPAATRRLRASPGPDRRGGKTQPLDADPPGRVEQFVTGQQLTRQRTGRVGSLPPVGRGEEDAELEHPGHLGRDPAQVTPLEHDLGEPGVQGIHARQRSDGVLVAYQHLPFALPIVSTTSHRPTLTNAGSVGQVIPVSAPPRVAQRLRSAPDGPLRFLHRGSRACYVGLRGWAIGLVGPDAVQVPCALRSRSRDPLPFDATSAYVRQGVLHLDGTPLVVGRFTDVGVRRLDPEGITRRATDSATPLVVPPTAVSEFVVRLCLPPNLTAAHVSLLLGRGDGLTPLGDDILAGWLTVHRAAGVPTPTIDRLVRAHFPRTTMLSATLLDCALHGEAIPEFASHLAALGTPDEGAATTALYAVGHTSGAGLAYGARLALSAVRHRIGTAA